MMFDFIKRIYYKELFITSPLAILINPAYITRNGLYKNILSFSPMVVGDVFDFGCGSKPYQSLFTNATSYVGVDVKISGHDHENSKIDCYHDGKCLPFNDNSFDSIVSFEVLEHVFNIGEIILELNRVLKPNGVFVFSIPFAWEEHEVPYDFARYSNYGITHVLGSGGFEIVELNKTSSYFLALCQMFIAYFHQYVRPTRSKIVLMIFQILFTFPITALSLLLDLILPRRYSYFCNIVALAKKVVNQPKR